MDFEGSALLASLFVSSIGFVAFVYGKRQSRLPQLITGILLSVFPYFISNVYLILGIAAGLLAAMAAAIKFGL